MPKGNIWSSVPLPCFWFFVWFFMWAGQRPRRGPEGIVFCMVTFRTSLRHCQIPLNSVTKVCHLARDSWEGESLRLLARLLKGLQPNLRLSSPQPGFKGQVSWACSQASRFPLKPQGSLDNPQAPFHRYCFHSDLSNMAQKPPDKPQGRLQGTPKKPQVCNV